NGTLVAGSHVTGYMLDQVPDAVNNLATSPITSLDVGAANAVTVSGSIDTTGLSAGTHTVYIMEDLSQVVDESNESNNVGSFTFDVVSPVGSISINDVSITEGNSGTKNATFTVTRTGGSGAFSVNYTTAPGTATSGTDYVAASGVLNFADGVNTQTFTVGIKGDTTIEPTETFFVNLSDNTGGTLSDAQGLGTIRNDDGTAATSLVSINDVSITEGNSGTKTMTFTV